MSSRSLSRTLLALAVAALCSSLAIFPARATPGLSSLEVTASPDREDGRGTLAALWSSVRSALSALRPVGEPASDALFHAEAFDQGGTTPEPWGGPTPSPQPTPPGPPQPGPTGGSG